MPERRTAPDAARPKPAVRPKDRSKEGAGDGAGMKTPDRYVPPDIAGVTEQGFRGRTQGDRGPAKR